MRRGDAGSRVSASAMLVIGPSVHSVTVPARLVPSASRRCSRRHAASAAASRLPAGRAVEPGLAMDILGRHQLVDQRPDGAGEHRDLGPAGQFADLARIASRSARGHIAGDGGDADQLELRDASANRMATASSWPGSVSMMILRAFGHRVPCLTLFVVLELDSRPDHISFVGKDANRVCPSMSRSVGGQST